MFSKTLIVGAVALAFVTVGWLTVQSSIVTPPAASSQPKGDVATADQEDFYRTMLPSTSGWWEYRDDSLTNKTYAYHYVTTPTGPVIDATYELQSKPGQAVNTCGTTMFEPECFGSANYSIP